MKLISINIIFWNLYFSYWGPCFAHFRCPRLKMCTPSSLYCEFREQYLYLPSPLKLFYSTLNQIRLLTKNNTFWKSESHKSLFSKSIPYFWRVWEKTLLVCSTFKFCQFVHVEWSVFVSPVDRAKKYPGLVSNDI